MEYIVVGFILGLIYVILFQSKKKKKRRDKLGPVVKNWKGYKIRRMDGGFGVYVGKMLKKGPFEEFEEVIDYLETTQE